VDGGSNSLLQLGKLEIFGGQRLTMAQAVVECRG
jgi:hypothetical protein